jgi:hypothetical protein
MGQPKRPPLMSERTVLNLVAVVALYRRYSYLGTSSYGRTKGIQFQNGYVDRFSRETLEKRLDKTPSNARCFAQGSSLMCWSILESLMGTTHGAEELGLCPHGLACQAGAWGRYPRVLPRIWPYLAKIKSDRAGKNILRSP